MPVTALAAVGVLMLSGAVDVGANHQERRTVVAVAMYAAATPAAREIAAALSDAVRAELSAAGRFEVFMAVDTGPVGRRIRLSTTPPVEDAVRLGRSLGVEKVVCGVVRDASASVSRSESKKTTTYTLNATVTVQHLLVDVASLKVESDVVLTRTARESRSSPYLETSISEVLKRLAAQTAQLFVRRLVPDIEGTVLARITVDGKPRLLISLGARHGLGPVMDLEFARMEQVMDENGKPVTGPDGQPVLVRRKVSAIMRPDHKQPTVCVGQPRSIQDQTAEVEVGYYHNVFLGRKFEFRREAMDAIRVGDLVRPVPRPDDIP